MIKKWLQKATDAVASVKQSKDDTVEVPNIDTLPIDEGLATSQQLDLIVVPQSALDAVADDPHQICDAVTDYVTHLLEVGYYTADEIPNEAMWAYHLAAYVRQTSQGGHAAFVQNSVSTLASTTNDMMSGAMAMGHDAYHGLFADLAAWVATHPDEVKAQSGDTDDQSEDLLGFDAHLDTLDADENLTALLGQWIASLEITLSVPDDTIARVYEGILLMNDKKAPRESNLNIAEYDFMLSDPLQLGLGHVGGMMKTPLVAIGNGSTLPVDGENQLAWLVLTSEGKAWGVPGDHGCELRQYDEESVGFAVGDTIGFASNEQIEVARKVAKQTNAAAALDLCLSALPRRCTVDQLSVRSAGLGKDDIVGASIYVVANTGTEAFTLVVTAEGAKLLEEPTHTVLASATRAEIAAHAREHDQRAAA